MQGRTPRTTHPCRFCPPLLLLVTAAAAVTALLRPFAAAYMLAGAPRSTTTAAAAAARRVFHLSSSSSHRTIRAATVRMASTDATVAENLAAIRARVQAAADAAGRGDEGSLPRLVAVSKTKPAIALQECYDAGQRHFGENYVHEVLEKGPVLPKDIKWHFIGHLQSNKAKPLVSQVPNLWMVETVDSTKLADKLQAAAAAVMEQRGQEPLRVLIQVDTSGEDTKSGVAPEEAPAIAQHILAHCPQLKLAGVMTIGAPGDLGCFDRLVAARAALAAATGLAAEGLELSMGMSGDFEEAIARGSTNVRVGSSIFGERDYAALKKAKEEKTAASAASASSSTSPGSPAK